MQNNKIKRCIIWGAGYFGRYIQEAVRDYGYEIIAYCDAQKTGKVGGYDILDIQHAISLCVQDNDIDIIIGVKNHEFENEIKETIESEFPASTNYKYGMMLYSYIQERQLEQFYQKMNYRWEVNLQNEFLVWLNNIETEVEYWVKDVADIRGVSNSYNKKCRENTIFSNQLLIENLTENSVVLDIGCGLVSPYGDILSDGKKIRLIPVDALAYFYNRINAYIDDGKKTNYRCKFGMFEFMANLFEKNIADAIIINNALDHCIDPYRSLMECLYILKRGGVLCMSHRRAEAVYEKWSGLHRWNIDCIDGKLVLWNKENAINVSDILSDYVTLDIEYNEDADREAQTISVRIIKEKDFSLSQFVNTEKDADVLVSCVELLMKQQAKTSSSFERLLDSAEFV